MKTLAIQDSPCGLSIICIWQKLLMALIILSVGMFLFSGTAAGNDKQNSVAVIYASKYGSTARIADLITAGIGNTAVAIDVKSAVNLFAYKHFVLGTAVYRGKISLEMMDFLEKNKETIKDRVVGIFVVCASPLQEMNYANQFAEILGKKPAAMAGFRGWMKKYILSPDDYLTLENTYKKYKMPFEDYDLIDKVLCSEYAIKINEIISIAK